MHGKTTFHLVLLAALASSCLPCLAQSALEPPELFRYSRWGPLRVRPGFQVSNLGYENNIFASTTDEVGDYRVTLSPKIEGLVLFGDRAFLTIKERLDYTAYLEHTNQNFLDQRGSARVTFPMRRIGYFVEGVLNRVKERPVDELDIRRDRDENGLGLGVIFVPGWRAEIEIGSSRIDLSYFDEDADPNDSPTISERLDRVEYRHKVQVNYHILGRTRMTVDGYVDTIDFDSSTSSGRDALGWGALPGIDFGEGGPLSGSARIGWAEIDAEDPAFADFADVVGRAEIAYRPNRQLTIRFSSHREPGFTTSGDSIYFLDTRAGLRVVQFFNRIMGVEAGGSVSRLTFPDSEGNNSWLDTTDSYHGGLRFRLAENSLGRRVEFSIRVQHSRRKSTLGPETLSRTTVGFGADLGF